MLNSKFFYANFFVVVCSVFLAAPIVYAQELNSVKALLKSQIKELKRPIVVYHYGAQGGANYKDERCLGRACDERINLTPGPQALHEPEVEHYFKAMAAQFARGQDYNWMVKGGLYAAIDPLQSGNYAQDLWMLLRISVPGNVRYLDIRLPQLAQVFDQLSRNASSLAELAIFLSSEHVVMIAYNWDDSSFSECQTNSRSANNHTAFNFIDPAAFSSLNINLFSSILEKHPSSEKIHEYGELLKEISVSDRLLDSLQQVIKATRPIQGQFSRDVLSDAWTDTLKHFLKKMTNEDRKVELLKLHDEVFTCSVDHPEELLP